MRLNLSEAICHRAKYFGKSLAIGGAFELSYDQLNDYSGIIAHALSEHVGNHSTVAILTHQNIQFVCALLGIMRSNNVFALVNPTLTAEQINKVISTSQCRAVIVGHDFAQVLAPSSDLKIFAYADLLEMKPSYPCHLVPHPEDIAGIIFSSGTTGTPKGIIRTHYSVLSEALMWLIELQLNRESSFLIYRPLYYTGGFVLLCATLLSGGRVDLFDQLDLSLLLQYSKSRVADWAFFVPSQLVQLLDMVKNGNNNGLQIAKNVLTMGAPIDPDIKIHFRNFFNCNVIESWGNSEGLGAITDADDLSQRPRSIGRPFFCDELFIVDDNGNPLPPKTIGRLAGYSDNAFLEYLGDSQLTREVLKGNLIISDDLGYMDQEGYFYILGRCSDKIVVNGNNVFPNDIECVVKKQDGIMDCVVLGIPDRIMGEVPIAAVITDSGRTNVTEILAIVNSQLAQHQQLRDIVVVPDFPRNQGGKVLKTELCQLLDGKKPK